MKKLLSILFLLFALPVLAQAPVVPLRSIPAIPASKLDPHWGFVRKAPCGVGAGDNCGSNPPTWHLTPDQCGILISTGAARNADGVTFSNIGVRHTLPTVAEFTAAGMGDGAGAPGSSGTANREAQCEFHFVMGAPGPSNYLRVGIDGVQGVDKVTPFGQGSYDLFYGDLVFPYLTPGVITFIWNSSSWLVRSGSPAMMEKLQMGQQSSHGQGRLFIVTADPSWWTVGTAVGKLAYCPSTGLGTVANSNGGFQLTQIPLNCAFRDNDTGSSTTQWIVMRNIVSTVVTGIAAGAAYSAGTAPNGVAYAAGNYAVLTVTATTGFSSGDTFEAHNMPTTLGSRLEGKYITKLIDATHLELHEQVDDYGNSGGGGATASPIGPPSSFIAGDTLNGASSPVAGSYTSLNTGNIASARITNPTNGVDVDASLGTFTIVGMVRRTTTTGYQDTTTNRLVASLFNPVEKKCQSVTAADRTVTSLTFVEVNSDLRCNFVYMTGVNAKSMSLGDQGRRVRYTATVGAGNGTASDGCEFAVGFDGITPEPETPGFVNPAGVTGGRQTVSVSGNKAGLTETNHYVTLLARAVTGGTCTIYSGSTNLAAWIWQ